jgi:hypothetical protein
VEGHLDISNNQVGKTKKVKEKNFKIFETKTKKGRN